MLTTLIALELALLEKLTREELITDLIEHRGYLSLEFSRGWLERQSTEGLRLFLLAAKLVRALRCQSAQPLL
jgi:hypothetical protein